MAPDPQEANTEDECSLKICLWKVVCFFLAIIGACFVIAFLFFFGLAYEFVILYFNRKEFIEDDEEFNNYDENQEHRMNVELERERRERENNRELECSDYIILFFIIAAGIALQPLYIMFYVLWGIMWFIKEYGWWCFFFEYGF